MEISSLPIVSSLPSSFKDDVAYHLVNFLTKQAEKYAGTEIANKITLLSNHKSFALSVEEAMITGIDSFISKYQLEDEDLVDAIITDQHFWDYKSVQKEIKSLISHPELWFVDKNRTASQHFDDVLQQRKNRNRVNKAIGSLLLGIVEELWKLPGTKEIRDVYSLLFQKVSDSIAQKQVTVARDELDAVTHINKEIKQALMELVTAYGKNLLNAPTIPSILRPRPFHNLPYPDYADFIGRQSELEWLRIRLNPSDRAWQIAITGIGGVGKSALAQAIAFEYIHFNEKLPDEEKFDAIVWISAKEEVLTVHGREKASLPELVLRSLEDVYSAISRVLDREEISRALPEAQGHLVKKALQEQRTLLIMDNIESINDDRIKMFLRDIPAPTKTIITSREWVEVSDSRILQGLPKEEAYKLILEEAKVRDANLNEKQILILINLTAGLPLPIKLGVARLASGESFTSVSRWMGNATGDLPEYCVKGQADLAFQRDPNTNKLLLAASLFDNYNGGSRDALGYVADLSIADRDSGLTQLLHLFLLSNLQNERFNVLAIVQRYVGNQFSQIDSEGIIERWLQWLISFCQKNSQNLELEIENQKNEFSIEYINLLRAIRWCLEQERWNELFLLAEGTWSYAYITSLFHEFKEILDAAYKASKSLKDEKMEGRVILQYARLNWVQQGIYTDELKQNLLLAEDLAARYSNDSDLCMAWYTHAHALFKQNNVDQSEKYANDLLSFGEPDNTNQQFKFWGAYRFSEIEETRSNYEKASEWLNQAENISKDLKATRLYAHVLHRRSAILLKQKNYQDAETILVMALEIDTRRGEQRYIAINKCNLGRVYIMTDNLPLAKVHLQEAYEIFMRLGMTNEANEAHLTLEQFNR